MSSSIESNFKREFNQMMKQRHALTLRYNTPPFSLHSLPAPKVSLPKSTVCLIKGIKERFFERLNNTEVQLIAKTVLPKRQVLSDGTFRRDAQGKYVTESVRVPSGGVAVLSGVSIGLRRFVEQNGVRQEWKPCKGFRYVDYIEQGGRRGYVYVLPKQYVYRLNLTALVISCNKQRTYYHGARLALQNGTHLYMFVVPYTYRISNDVRVLLLKTGIDFTAEIQSLLGYWQQTGIIFDLSICQLDAENLGLKVLDSKLDEYQPFSLSLAEEARDDLNLEASWKDGDGVEFEKQEQRRGDNGRFK